MARQVAQLPLRKRPAACSLLSTHFPKSEYCCLLPKPLLPCPIPEARQPGPRGCEGHRLSGRSDLGLNPSPVKKSLYFSEPQSPGTNESFPEAPCGSLIQGNRVPFNSLGRVRAELEHFMGHSQMKHSAFVWSSVSQQERDQCIYRPDAPREEAKNSCRIGTQVCTLLLPQWDLKVSQPPFSGWEVLNHFFVLCENRGPDPWPGNRGLSHHLHLCVSVSHCFEIPANTGGPSCSCLCGLSLVPLIEQLNPLSVAVPGLCAEVEEVYRM